MRKIKFGVLYLIGLVFFSSCQEQPILKGNKLSFGQSSCYLLGENELYQPIIDSILLEKYKVFYNLENIQMPINRVVTRSKDTLFIALTTEPKINRVEQAHNAVKTHKVLSKITTDSTLSYFLTKDKYYNYRYIYQDKSTNFIFLFNYISTDSSHIYNMYKTNEYVKECTKCEF